MPLRGNMRRGDSGRDNEKEEVDAAISWEKGGQGGEGRGKPENSLSILTPAAATRVSI